ncbi:MAG: glycosyltransferase family 2 protein [Actinomycetota bacterium]
MAQRREDLETWPLVEARPRLHSVPAQTTARRRMLEPLTRIPSGFRLLLIGDLLAAGFYFGWWLQAGHVGTPALFALLAFAEMFNLLHLLGLWHAVSATKFVPPPLSTTQHTIDVFIATRGEPIDVLVRTVRAVVAMEGSHRTFVLDDAARPEVKALALSHDASYIARSLHAGAKAGNLNDALFSTSGELVAFFDADHVPRSDFLTRLEGYFEDPSVAFVQTPQYYGNASVNEVSRGAFEQQAIFYGPICRGKNGLNAAFCCGTNVIFRREALASVGGFTETSVVEDFVTSMKIHRRGWRSIYYPYVLAEGLGPETLRSYARQQFRWARGSIGALVSGEPFKPGFTFSQRLQYLLATTFYLIGLVTPIYVMLPILYMVAGWSPFSVQSGTFVLFYAPFLLLSMATMRKGLGGQLRREHLQFTFGTFPVYAMAAFAAFTGAGRKFRVTGTEQGSRKPPLSAWIATGAWGASCIAIVAGFIIRPLDERTVTNAAWALINTVLLFGTARLTIREWLGKTKTVSFHPRGAPAGLPPLPEWAISERIPSAPRSRLEHWAPRDLVVVITAGALAIRLALAGLQSVRLDESLSLEQSRMPLVALWRSLVSVNVHVPLYHTILHFWIAMWGTSALSIRIPSVVFGAACIPLVYIVASRFVGARSAVLAAGIAAVFPFWIWHSDEARMYPLLLMLTLASLALLFRAVDAGGWLRWSAYALVSALTLYTHYAAFLILPVHGIYLLLVRPNRKRVFEWMLAGAAAIALFLPWLIALYKLRIVPSGIASITNGIRTPPVDHSVFGVVYSFLVFLAVFVIGYHGAVVLAAAAAVLAGMWPAVAIASALGHRVRLSRAAKFLLVWLLLPVALAYLANLFKPGIFFQKYLIAASIPIVIMLGGLAGKLIRSSRAGVVLVVLAFGALTVGAVAQNLEGSNPVREDFRDAAKIISADMQPGDTLLAMPVFLVTPINYELPSVSVQGHLSNTESPAYVINHVIPDLATHTRGGSIWVLTLYESTIDSHGAVLLAMDRGFERTASYEFGPQMKLLRYRVPTGWEPPK